jgi:hypothetical protein
MVMPFCHEILIAYDSRLQFRNTEHEMPIFLGYWNFKYFVMKWIACGDQALKSSSIRVMTSHG